MSGAVTKFALAVAPLVAAGCGGDHAVVPSPDRMVWAGELGRTTVASDPALVRSVKQAASASGARVLDASVLALQRGRRVPVVTLQSDDPAACMKHRLRGFLDRIGYFQPDSVAFVELLDDNGEFAWSGGRLANGGMVHSRPDLDSCSPVGHSQLVGAAPPPCPAD
jgi:hypothetical protein